MSLTGIRQLLLDNISSIDINPETELEVRFKECDRNKLFSMVNRIQNLNLEYDVINFGDLIGSISQDAKFRLRTFENKEVEKIKKKTNFNIDLPNHWIRISNSDEWKYNYQGEYTYERKVTRISIKRPSSILDISIIKPRDLVKLEDLEYKYEIEVEYVNGSDMKDYVDDVAEYYKLYLGTEVIYSKEQLQRFINYMNLKLNPNDYGKSYINTSVFSKAITFKYRHLTSQSILRKSKGDEPYVNIVTYKGDGERKIVAISSEVGVWMFYGDQYSLITNDIVDDEELTVLDTEFFEDLGKLTTIRVLDVIDMLYYQGKDIRSLPMLTDIQRSGRKESRFSYYQMYVSKNQSFSINSFIDQSKKRYLTQIPYFDILRVKPMKKVNIGPNLVSNFYLNMSTMLRRIEYESERSAESENIKPTPTDGLVISTSNVGYIAGKSKDFPAYLKWKPTEDLTIDFLIYHMREEYIEEFSLDQDTNWGNVEHLLLSREGDHYVAFEDPDYNPVEIDMQGYNYFDTQTVEMKRQGRGFIFHRFRYNKDANSITVAKDNWITSVSNPTREVLNGEDSNFTLMKKYHNRIKRSLFYKSRDQIRGNYVLDIGSGRGGDIAKILRYEPSHLFLVEPSNDKETIDELERRLSLLNFSDYTIISLEAQNWETIVTYIQKRTHGKGVNVISMMNSLNFFWESEDILRGLSQNIRYLLNKDGYFLYMLLDGSVVMDELYKNDYNIERDNMFIRSVDLNTNKIYGNKILFYLPGFVGETSKEGQVEYISYIDTLMNMIDIYKEEQDKYTDGEELMTEEEHYLSRMYRYGYVRKRTRDSFKAKGTLYIPKDRLIQGLKEEEYYLSGSRFKRMLQGETKINIVGQDILRVSVKDRSLHGILNDPLILGSIRPILELGNYTDLLRDEAVHNFGFPYTNYNVFYESKYFIGKEGYDIVSVSNRLSLGTIIEDDLQYICYLLDMNIYILEPARVGVRDTSYSDGLRLIEFYKSSNLLNNNIAILRYKDKTEYVYERLLINNMLVIDNQSNSYLTSILDELLTKVIEIKQLRTKDYYYFRIGSSNKTDCIETGKYINGFRKFIKVITMRKNVITNNITNFKEIVSKYRELMSYPSLDLIKRIIALDPEEIFHPYNYFVYSFHINRNSRRSEDNIRYFSSIIELMLQFDKDYRNRTIDLLTYTSAVMRLSNIMLEMGKRYIAYSDDLLYNYGLISIPLG